MDSTRQLKVSRLIQKELGEVFQKETRILFGNALITVTQVRVSPDLGIAKVYISIMATKDRQAIFNLVQEEKAAIRKRLGNMVGKQLRVVPDLAFFIDDSLDYAMKIEELLKK